MRYFILLELLQSEGNSCLWLCIVATDLSYGVWPHLSAMLLGEVCNWPVLNLSHEAVSCPAELGLQATVTTIPCYTSGNK